MTKTEAEIKAEPPGFLERRFELAARDTNVRTEILAGVTTFLTMAYIILVNPAILGQAGMPVAAVAAATCLAAAFASILMGFTANVPLALAPGMGSTPISASPSSRGWACPGRWPWAASSSRAWPSWC
jgi:xanthine/uracil/vitamin C permease (AzgA family)